MRIRENQVVNLTKQEYDELKRKVCTQRKYIIELENKVHFLNAKLVEVHKNYILDEKGRKNK